MHRVRCFYRHVATTSADTEIAIVAAEITVDYVTAQHRIAFVIARQDVHRTTAGTCSRQAHHAGQATPTATDTKLRLLSILLLTAASRGLTSPNPRLDR